MNSGWTRNRKDTDRRFSPAHEPITDVDHAYPVDVVQDVSVEGYDSLRIVVSYITERPNLTLQGLRVGQTHAHLIIRGIPVGVDDEIDLLVSDRAHGDLRATMLQLAVHQILQDTIQVLRTERGEIRPYPQIRRVELVRSAQILFGLRT